MIIRNLCFYVSSIYTGMLQFLVFYNLVSQLSHFTTTNEIAQIHIKLFLLILIFKLLLSHTLKNSETMSKAFQRLTSKQFSSELTKHPIYWRWKNTSHDKSQYWDYKWSQHLRKNNFSQLYSLKAKPGWLDDRDFIASPVCGDKKVNNRKYRIPNT